MASLKRLVKEYQSLYHQYDNPTYKERLREIVSLAQYPSPTPQDKKGGTPVKQDWRTIYYRPMMGKSFEAALTQFVTREFPFLQGTMVVSLFVKELRKLIDAYYPPTSYLKTRTNDLAGSG